jgi:hypothetical protein
MALIVAPAAGYDSLVTLAEAADYMAKFGRQWPADTGLQEVALRNATQYLCSQYDIKPECLNPVAQSVKNACCEAAWRAADGSLFSDVDPQAVVSETVGPISTNYAQPTNGGQKRFGVIDALMRGCVVGGAGVVKFVRA